MNTIVRRALLTDIEGILDVVSETFSQDFDFGNGFDRERCQRFFRLALDDPNELVIVATGHDRRILGFIHYENKPPTNGTVYLNMIGVRKDCQGLGIGTILLREGDNIAVRYICDECGVPNLATIYLSTSRDNPVGQRLYLKCGYRHVGDIPGLVGEGNTELVMLKKVADVRYRQNLWNRDKEGV